MSDMPKCTSWLGHKFEGRYSFATPDGYGVKLGRFAGTSDGLRDYGAGNAEQDLRARRVHPLRRDHRTAKTIA